MIQTNFDSSKIPSSVFIYLILTSRSALILFEVYTDESKKFCKDLKISFDTYSVD
jgi:hypothetical protein